MRTKYIGALFFLIIVGVSSLRADQNCDHRPPSLPRERRSLLFLGAGFFNVLHANYRCAQFQLEYKWSASWYGVQPIVSTMATGKGAFYFCAGACYDIFLGKFFVLTPSFAPGIYFKGKGKDLGFPLEFRSSIAVAVELSSHQRMGAQFYHISNASLGAKNPGEESLLFFYGISF